MWYLGRNRPVLPRSKEESVTVYEQGLARRGVDTSGWFDQRLHTSGVGVMAMIGWEKAVGDADELAWWDAFITRTSF